MTTTMTMTIQMQLVHVTWLAVFAIIAEYWMFRALKYCEARILRREEAMESMPKPKSKPFMRIAKINHIGQIKP